MCAAIMTESAATDKHLSCDEHASKLASKRVFILRKLEAVCKINSEQHVFNLKLLLIQLGGEQKKPRREISEDGRKVEKDSREAGQDENNLLNAASHL